MAKSPITLSFLPLLMGGILGIFTGVFLGEYAAIFRPIGQIYIMLLEVAVFPYLITSLLHGLASMAPARAWRLFKNGWPFYLFIWGLTFGILALISLAFPQSRPSVFTDNSSDLSTLIGHLIRLLIPSDIFTALGQNSVPAVVLFCIAFGVALQQVKDKQPLLTILDAIRQASFTFWKFVVRMVPLAVFALLADTAGTIQVRNLSSIGLFIFLFFIGILLISFWLVPGCLQALTPLKFPEVISNLRSALAIALVTTLPASAIPFVMEATKNLAGKCGVEDPELEDVARAHLSVAYPLGQLGNFFVYLYILYAAFACGQAIPGVEAAFLPLITLLSCFGTPASSVNAVTFIGNSFHLPSSVNDLFVELLTVLRYGQVIASVMGYAFLSFTVILAYYGKLKIRWVSLAAVVTAAVVLILGTALTARHIYVHDIDNAPNPYLAFTLDPTVTKGVETSFAPDDDATILGPGETLMGRIARTGTLRVGYNPATIPFSYHNSAGQLVGYDVSYAYRLARDLNVKLCFVPFRWEDLDARLKAGAFDIAMSGIYVTQKRLLEFGVSDPYFQSPLAFFTLRERGGDFLTRQQLMARTDLRVGIFDSTVLIPLCQKTLPNAHIVTEPNYAELPDFNQIDGAFWTLAQAEALAAAHPQLVAVQTRDLGNPFLFAYLTPPQSDEFLRLLNYSLNSAQKSGFEQAQSDYWIQRLPRRDTTPRWSILRNVLGFGL